MMERLKWFYRAWRYRLKVEKREIGTLLEHLGGGDTAVDVGAHKGAFTYWMRERVGPRGRVFAFEPQPGLAVRLQSLCAVPKYQNVVIENLGLSSSSGTLDLKIPGSKASPSASFETTEDTLDANRSIAVGVTTLDEYFSKNQAGRIRLIKCDAEGHELEVFRGAERILGDHHPDLLFECEARHRRGGTVEEVFRYLTSLGYQGWCLHRDGLFELARFDPAIHQSDPSDRDYVNNFLFSQASPQSV
jgi:FkbM family methyltransferase